MVFTFASAFLISAFFISEFFISVVVSTLFFSSLIASTLFPEIRRKQIARCEKIGDKVLRALDRKASVAAKDTRTINDGLAVLEKAAKDGVIALSEAEVASLRNVVSDYTGVGLRELAGTMKDVAARQETLEQHLGEKDSTGVQITFVEGAEELAE